MRTCLHSSFVRLNDKAPAVNNVTALSALIKSVNFRITERQSHGHCQPSLSALKFIIISAVFLIRRRARRVSTLSQHTTHKKTGSLLTCFVFKKILVAAAVACLECAEKESDDFRG